MRRGGDYSFARPDLRELVAAGWEFAVRYTSRVDGGKNISAAEALVLSRAGLRILTVWENVGADRDPLKGRGQGVADAIAHHGQVAACGAPPDAVLFYAVDWNAQPGEFAAIGDYFEGCTAAAGLASFVGCYGHTRLLGYLFDRGVIGHGWIPMASSWSAGHVEPRAKLRQTVGATIGGGAVDLDEADPGAPSGWRIPVTYAPADLMAIQRYVHDKTMQDYNSLGIIHSTPQGGGYHEGQDLLAAANRAPGPRYPFSDYSYADARAVSADGLGRDLAAADRLAGDATAASAFDLGSGFPRWLEFNRWMRNLMLAKDPRTRDIREMIYTLDGVTVHRLDRTNMQPDSGDPTHLIHTHFSFFRDSLGRRHLDDNFGGMLREFFDGQTASTATGEDDEQMSTGEVKPGFAFGGSDGRVDELVTGVGLGPVNGGLFGNKRVTLGLSADFTPDAGVKLRVATKPNGKAWAVQTVTIKATDDRWVFFLPDATTKVNIGRMKRDEGDQDVITKADGTTSVTADAETCPVWWDLEFEKR
jgi:Domain of unknown function (DUF1906)